MMVYRRTWFSCVIWFLYTVLCIVTIGLGTGALIGYLTGVPLHRPIWCCLAAIPAAALYWCIRIVSVYARTKWTMQKNTQRILTGVATALILAFGILIRIMCLNGYMSGGVLPYGIVAAHPAAGEGGAGYLELASAALRQGSAAASGYGMDLFYVRLLTAALAFLGDKPASAVFLQILLQTAALILAFWVTRMLAGRLPACMACLYLACSAACLEDLFVFTPEWLFFVCWLFVMLITASFVRAYCEARLAVPAAVLWAVASGAATGFLAYLAVPAALLLIVTLSTVFGVKKRLEDRPGRNGRGMTAAVMAAALLSCAALWAAAAVWAPFDGGFVKDLAFLRTMFGNLSGSALLPAIPAGPESAFFLGATVFSSFLVFEYFRSGRKQNYMPWIVMGLIAVPASLCGVQGCAAPALYLWAVLGGLGLQNCLFGDQAKVIQAAIEEINLGAATEGGTNYIENPLPLPKKHVKKEMDYQYDVAQEDMKYDVEVPENDDFDLP